MLLEMVWTKGHAQDVGNNAADRLATAAALACACNVAGAVDGAVDGAGAGGDDATAQTKVLQIT